MRAVCVAPGPVLQVSRLIERAPLDAFIVAVLIGNNILRIFQRETINENGEWLMLLQLKLPQEDENIVSIVGVIAVEPLLVACITVANTLMILDITKYAKFHSEKSASNKNIHAVSLYALTSSINDNLSGCLSIQETIASSVYCCDLKINGYATVKCCAIKQLSLKVYMVVLGCTNGFVVEIIVSTFNNSIKVTQTILKSYLHFVNYDINAINIHHGHYQDLAVFLLSITSSNGIIITIPRTVSVEPNTDSDGNWTVRDDESNINSNSSSSVWIESQGSVDDEIAWLENKFIFTLLHQNLTSRQSCEVFIDKEAYANLRCDTMKESAHLVYTPSTRVDGNVTSRVLAIFDKKDLCIYFYEFLLSLEVTSGHTLDEPVPPSNHAQLTIKVAVIKQMLQCTQLDILGVVFQESRMMLHVSINNASQAILVYSLVSLLLDFTNHCSHIPGSRLLFPIASQYDTLLISDNTIYSMRDTEESTTRPLAPPTNSENMLDSVFDITTAISTTASILSNLQLFHLYAPSMPFGTIITVLRALCTHVVDICNEEMLSLLATLVFTISIADKPPGTTFYDSDNTVNGILGQINGKLLREIQCNDKPSLLLKQNIQDFINNEATVHSCFTVMLAIMTFIVELSPTLHYLLVTQWNTYCQCNIDSEYRIESLVLTHVLLDRTNCPYLVSMVRLELAGLLYAANGIKGNFIDDVRDILVYCASCDMPDNNARDQTLRILMAKVLLLWSRSHPSPLISEFEQMVVDLDSIASHATIYLQLTLCDVLCNTAVNSLLAREETVVSAEDLEAIRRLEYSNPFMLKLLEVVASNKCSGTK